MDKLIELLKSIKIHLVYIAIIAVLLFTLNISIRSCQKNKELYNNNITALVDSISYYKEHPNEPQLPATDYQRTVYKFVNEHFPDKTLKFEHSYQCDFYSDGLRWSIFE